MNRTELIETIHRKKSVLCIGLDSDIEKIPAFLHKFEDPVFEFNKKIFNATYDISIAYKINVAFYESRGIEGWLSLKKTVDYIRSSGEKVFLIADAKRTDIENTSKHYAKAFFDKDASGLDFDAVTVLSYLGQDTIRPFLEYKNKWTIILGLSSNKDAFEFQLVNCLVENKTKYFFEYIIEKSKNWGTEENIMYVVGATRADLLKSVRKLIPNHFLLIPGIGAQGGSIENVVHNAINTDVGIILNVSRAIIFSSNDENFDSLARKNAKKFYNELKNFLTL